MGRGQSRVRPASGSIESKETVEGANVAIPVFELDTLLQGQVTSPEWAEKVMGLMRMCLDRRVYQTNCFKIIQYILLQSPTASVQTRETLRYFWTHLRESYCVQGPFKEGKLMNKKLPTELLRILYEQADHLGQQIEQALQTLYPDSITALEETILTIAQKQITLDYAKLGKLVLSSNKIDVAHKNYQKINTFLGESSKISTDSLTVYIGISRKLIELGFYDAAEHFFRALVGQNYTIPSEATDISRSLFILNIRLFSIQQFSVSFGDVGSKSPTILLHQALHDEQRLFLTLYRQHYCQGLSGRSLNEECREYALSHLITIENFVLLLNQNLLNIDSAIEAQFQKILGASSIDVCRYKNSVRELLAGCLSNLADPIIEKCLQVGTLLNSVGCSLKFKQLTELARTLDINETAQRTATVQLQQFFSKYFLMSRHRSISVNEQKLQAGLPTTIVKAIHWLMDQLYGRFIEVRIPYQLAIQTFLQFYRYDDLRQLLREQSAILEVLGNQWYESTVLASMRRMLISRSFVEIQKDLNSHLSLLQSKQALNSPQKAMKDLACKMYVIGAAIEPKTLAAGLTQDSIVDIVQSQPQLLEVIDYDEVDDLIRQVNGGKSLVKGCPDDNRLILKMKLTLLAIRKGKEKYAHSMIQQIMKHEPLWLASELLKAYPSVDKLDRNTLLNIFQGCNQPQDCKVLINAFKSKAPSKSMRLTSIASQLFQDAPDYIVLGCELVLNEAQFRNHNAQIQSIDESFCASEYQLFLTLLGTDTKRAFYHAYMRNLQATKLMFYFKEGIRKTVFSPQLCLGGLAHLLKHFLCHQEIRISYSAFQKEPESNKQLNSEDNPLAIMLRYLESAKSLIAGKGLAFIRTQIPADKLTNFLFDEAFRLNTLVKLRDKNMTEVDLSVYNQICEKVGLNASKIIMDLLSDSCNSQDSLNSKASALLQKMIVLNCRDSLLVDSLLTELLKRIHSIRMLYFLTRRIAQQAKGLLKGRISPDHLTVLLSLAQVQTSREFYGLVPHDFLVRKVWFCPKLSLTGAQERIIRNIVTEDNFLVLSKALYLMNGMSDPIEKKVQRIFKENNTS